MELSSSFLLRELRNFALLFVLLSYGAEAGVWGSCLLKLSAGSTALGDKVLGRTPLSVDHKKLLEESRKARAEAKDEGSLKVTKGDKVRSPEEVEAWLINFSNKIKATRDGTQPKMSIEEFFGMIEGGFGRVGFRFEQIFKEYNIKTIRLVKKNKFDSIIHKTSTDPQAKDEVLVEVPDFPVGDPQAAAIWIKDLYLSLHDAATNMVAARINALPKNQVRKEWGNKYRIEVRDLDRGVKAVLTELDSYMKSKNPEEKNPLDLANRSLSPSAWHHGVSLFKASDALLGGAVGAKLGHAVAGENGAFYGGLAGTLFGVMTKIRFPLNAWKPSQKWLVSKEAFELERERLSARLANYYTYQAIDKNVTRITKAIVMGTALSMGYYFYTQKSLVGDAEEGLDEEAEKSTAKLDDATEEQLSKLNVEELSKRYDQLVIEEKELLILKQNALDKEDLVLAGQLNAKLVAKVKYMQKVLAQLEALNPEGIEYDR